MRETQKSSKAAIFAAQRGDVTTARAKLQQGLEVALRIKPLVDTHPHLRHGTYSAALEEYGEGVAFLQFVQHGTLVRFADFGGLLTPEEYLGAVSDLTGEMQRYAVLRATARDVEAVKRCRDVTDDILAAMMCMGGAIVAAERESGLRLCAHCAQRSTCATAICARSPMPSRCVRTGFVRPLTQGGGAVFAEALRNHPVRAFLGARQSQAGCGHVCRGSRAQAEQD